MNIKRITAMALAVVMLILSLSSCGSLFGGDNGGNETPGTGDGNNDSDTNKPGDNGNGDTGDDDAVVFKRIIHSGGDLDLFNVRAGMMEIVGPTVTVDVFSQVEATDGEVVFGLTPRAITTKAREALEQLISRSAEYDCGYIIYSDGKNVAVYWQLEDMATIAIKEFVDKCIDEMRLDLPEGVIASELYVQSEYELEKHWLALEAQAATEVVNALKRLYAYYDSDKIIDWMANLYDPEAGAFYYSISARDNEPYRPDIESTYQITGLLVSSGALDSRNDLPTEIKEKMIAFAQNMQSPDDGYFYHPQWPQGRDQLNTDRYGRDLTRASGTITDLNIDLDGDGVEDEVYPFYCAPNGTKCADHVGTPETCTFPVRALSSHVGANITGFVTGALGSQVSAAVSTAQSSFVTATAASSHPDYSSREAFKNWLYEYNASIKEDSGKAHNLSAIASEIKAHGYADIVAEQIMTAQDEVYAEQIAAGIEPTGLWQRNVDYKAVWGILKYASYYNSEYWTTPMSMEYITCIIKTCIKVIALPADGEYAANDIYNMWNAIDRIMTHINRNYGNNEKQVVYDLLRENAASLVDNSLAKLAPFKRVDGSFSYKSNGRSLSSIYGTPISLGSVEGDVNAVALCCQMYEAIFTALGYQEVPLFTKAQGERFIETIMTCAPIEKVEKELEIYDFESPNLPDNMSVSVSSPNSIGAIEADPEDPTNNVFHFLSTPITSGSADKVSVATYELGSNCYVFDADLYIASEGTEDGYVFQIFLGDAYIIAINKSGKKITVKDDMTGSGAASTSHTYGTVDADTWFRLTCEVYVPGEEMNGLDKAQIKLWIDGEYYGISEFFYDKGGNGVFNESYGEVLFWSMKKRATNVYFDNCYCASEDKLFDESDDSFVDMREEQ